MAYKRQRGMTLVELLVVMVILAMVSALLVQGMGTALVTYERVQRNQQQSLQPTLAYHWLSSTLHGAQAELKNVKRQFSGEASWLSGYSHQSLSGQPGQVLPFSWTLEQDQDLVTLVYRQADIEWQILSWPKGSRARFLYRGIKGGVAESWPSYGDEQPEADGRMPSAIVLEVTPVEQDPQRWYIFMPTRHYPRGDYRDF